MKIIFYWIKWLLIIGILFSNCSWIDSSLLATSDSFPISEQTSHSNNQNEEIGDNSTEEHYMNDLVSDKEVPSSDVIQDIGEANDQIDESLLENTIEAVYTETVPDRNYNVDKDNPKENIDKTTILAETFLLDSISTNSGINGIPDIPDAAPVITIVEKVSEINIESTLDDENEEFIHNNTQSPPDLPVETLKTIDTISDPTNHISEPSETENIPLAAHPNDGTEIVRDVPPDEQINMINDSGGSERMSTKRTLDEVKLEPIDIFTEIIEKPEVNITVEEQIPVFSEWAQKHLEEAEKKLEQEAVNVSTMKKNSTQGHKTQVVKLRAKNYASPDCGAKIIAANSEASSTGSVLTTTKDEYLLSPCTSRIWFVVELCEAIQAEVIDLANFELFSSSPKNFSISVSNRFPNREWSNVGRFTAKDERDIQSFDLYPHLFGKYVRVDIHSHYNSEHFCPISLFRVYGTSEFEAFETENQIHSSDDSDNEDEDEDEAMVTDEAKIDDTNIFKSAGNVVMSIVKKAAASFVKNDKQTSNRSVEGKQELSDNCMTPRFIPVCKHCTDNMTLEVGRLLNCKLDLLNNLLSSDVIRKSIYKSQICANLVGLDLTLICNNDRFSDVSIKYLTDIKKDYVSHMFPVRYVAAMCNILGVVEKKMKNASYVSDGTAKDQTNLTIDKMGGDKLLMPNMILPNEDEKLKGNKDKIVEAIKSIDSSEDQSVEREVSADDTSIDAIRRDTENLEPSQIQAPPTDDELDQIITTIPTESYEPKEQHELNEIKNIHQSTNDEVNGVKLDTINGNWEHMEVLLSTPVPELAEGNSSEENVNGALSSHQTGQKVHSESVFVRLSNRIKALERNMSLSGQYLEELSRRYKKQVEELQLAFARSLSLAEEQAKRNFEREQQSDEQIQKLREDLDTLTETAFSWPRIIIIFIAFTVINIFITLIVLKIWIRKYFQSVVAHTPHGTPRGNFDSAVIRTRRKSTDGVKDVSKVTKKQRRPSEEALHISGTYKDLLIQDDIVDINPDYEEYDSFVETRKKVKPKNRRLINVKRAMSVEPIGNRHDASSGDFEKLKLLYANAGNGINDAPLLDENYDIYIPGNDLAYNEFMPGGPSGSDIINGNDTSSSTSSNKKSKSRRLSSPAFLKSPFSRQNSKKSEMATGWEWYRLKRGSNTSQHEKPKSKSESPEVRSNGINGSISSTSPLNNFNSSSDSLKPSTMQQTVSDKKPGNFRRILKKVF